MVRDPDAPDPTDPPIFHEIAAERGMPDLPEAGRVTFTRDDGSTYERPDPDEFPDYDEIDSTTIVDDGAPDGD